jgi:hypothetical protein
MIETGLCHLLLQIILRCMGYFTLPLETSVKVIFANRHQGRSNSNKLHMTLHLKN